MKTLYKTTALLFAAGLAAAIGCSSAGGSGCGGAGAPTQNTLNCGRGTHEDASSHACVADTQAEKNRVQNGSSGSGNGNGNGSQHVSNAP